MAISGLTSPNATATRPAVPMGATLAAPGWPDAAAAAAPVEEAQAVSQRSIPTRANCPAAYESMMPSREPRSHSGATLSLLYKESLMIYTGWCQDGFNAQG
jgi:hypothetical protein